MGGKLISLFGSSLPDFKYWIINIPTYGRFVYYGTESGAEAARFRHSEREHVTGHKHLANIKNKQEKELVAKEIIGCAEDRKAGHPGIPYLPPDGWLS